MVDRVHRRRADEKVLAQGAIDRGGAARSRPRRRQELADIAVRKGDMLSLVVGRGGNHQCDSTAIKLVIAEVGGQDRTWNLAKDVVDDLRVGQSARRFAGQRRRVVFLPATPPPVAVISRRSSWSSQATSAREFIRELAARNLTTIRQRTRQHAEQTWDGAVAAMFRARPCRRSPSRSWSRR